MTGFDIESIPLQQCQPSGPKRSNCLSVSLAGVPQNRARPDGPKPIRLSPISSPSSRHALFSNSTGIANTASGIAALGNNTVRSFDTAIGFQSRCVGWESDQR